MGCENDASARAVLNERFPDVRYRKNVADLNSLPNCDVLSAGWPCQDLSQAGMTAGITGSQSTLIRHAFRLLEASKRKPQYVLFENVAFALHLQRGKAIREVVRELERQGYKWAYRILNTREFGLPQRRRRIFIVGARDVDPITILFDGVGPLEKERRSRYVGFYWTEGNRGVGWTNDGIPPLKGGSGLFIPSPPAIWDRRTHNFFSPGIRDAERLQGFKAGWTRAAAEQSGDRVRWRLIGNAVSVPIAKWIGTRIVATSTGSLRCANLPAGHYSKRHNVAWGGPGKRPTLLRVEQEGPARPKRAKLLEFDFRDATPLSIRAASGFLSRLVESPLVVEHPFLVDLEQYCGRTDLMLSKAAA